MSVSVIGCTPRAPGDGIKTMPTREIKETGREMRLDGEGWAVTGVVKGDVRRLSV